MSVNRLPALKADSDIFTTFEGDNTVLMLWIGRQLLANAPDTNHTDGEYLPMFVGREQTMRAETRPDEPLSLLRLAHAWVERVVLEQFDAAISRCEDRGCAEVLTLLHDLFALTLLEENRGWFLEHDFLSVESSKTLPRAVELRCARIAPDALALVDAFNIPDQCLAAPIAT